MRYLFLLLAVAGLLLLFTLYPDTDPDRAGAGPGTVMRMSDTQPTESPTPMKGDLPAIPELVVADFSAPIQRQIMDAYAQLQANPLNSAANLKLGKLLHAYKLLPWAIACYERARQLEPDDYTAAYFLGIASAQAGADAAAIVNLRAALQLHREYAPARLRLAELLFKTGRLDEARALFEALLESDADSPWAHHELAQVLNAQGEQQAAIEHNLRAVELFDTFGPAHYALALAYRDRGETELAARHLARYQQQPDSNPPHVDPLLEILFELDISASAHIRRAKGLEAAGRNVDAVRELEQAVAMEPESIEARSQLIRLYAASNDFDRAQQHYLAVTAIRPNAVMANLWYGKFLGKLGRLTEAAAAFEKALQTSPDHTLAHTLLGQALEEMQKPQEAERHYRLALASDPLNHQAGILLARRLAMTGHIDEATPLLMKTLDTAGGDHGFYLYQVALVYASADETDKAQDYLQQARKAAVEDGQDSLLEQILQTKRQWQDAADQ
jgi:tetratricopeptide (TPR) repeat protein